MSCRFREQWRPLGIFAQTSYVEINHLALAISDNRDRREQVQVKPRRLPGDGHAAEDKRRRGPLQANMDAVKSKVTGLVPNALENLSRTGRPHRSGRRIRRKLWSRAPAYGEGKAKRRSG
jgi:hypothetical protein